MNISHLLATWCGINTSSKILIITDEIQKDIATSIKVENIYDIQIEHFSPDNNAVFLHAQSLNSTDLVVVLLSMDTYIKFGANKYFSPFDKPDWLRTKYVFIRLGISKDSLIQGLSTDKELVYQKIKEMGQIDTKQRITVTNESGTDISFQINPFTTCSHEILTDGGMAFLPPSETSSEIISVTANGKIVIDMTVGQLYHFGNLIDYFGLVSEPITLTIQDGIITDIFGDQMAADFKKKLFRLPLECRQIVELGQGLSQMIPTGLIGVDECIIDSCHFGFGDGGKCGTHLDVVIKNPSIRQADYLVRGEKQ